MLFYALSGCSGYRINREGNPLSQYGIETLSVPMFFNYSNLPEVSPAMTKETFRLLSGFKDLKLKSGYDTNSDAVLIGIVKTQDKVSESLKPSNLRVAEKLAPKSIGNRKTFYVPGSTTVKLYVQLIIIKKPTEDEIKLLQSEIGESVVKSDKVIVNQIVSASEQFTREAYDQPGTAVNATQNKAYQRRTVQTIAEQIAINIRDTILYAF